MQSTQQRPSVPGSLLDKTEGAKNPRVTVLGICTFNVRTLREDNKIIELEEELHSNKFKWDIIGMSETKRKDSHILQLDSRNMLYTSGGTTSYALVKSGIMIRLT